MTTIVTLPGHGLSKSAAARSNHWIKQLTGVDAAKSNGWAFEGSFVRFSETAEVPDGADAWYLSCVEDTSGTGRVYGRVIRLYQVADGELQEVKRWDFDSSSEWALRCRDDIAALMADPERIDEQLRSMT